MYYLASNFAYINWIIVSTAASVFILMAWVFPSLQKRKRKKKKTTSKSLHMLNRDSRRSKRQVYFMHAIPLKIQVMVHLALTFTPSNCITALWLPVNAVSIQVLIQPKVNWSFPLPNPLTTFQTSSQIKQPHKGEVHIYKECSLIWLPACSSPYSFLNRSFLNPR